MKSTFKTLVNLSDSVSTESQETENEPDGRSKNVKVFQTEWLEYYSWLAYDKEGDFMYYTLCTDGKKKHGMSKVSMYSITEFQCLMIFASLGHNKHTIYYRTLIFFHKISAFFFLSHILWYRQQTS